MNRSAFMLSIAILLTVLSVGYAQQVTIPTDNNEAMLIFTDGESEAWRHLEPAVKELQADGYEIYRIDVNSHKNLAREYQVWETPCMVMLIGGRLWQRESGCCSKSYLEDWFRSAASGLQKVAVNSFVELQTANSEKEYAAPIPDSLVGYDVHELSGGERILLEKPVAKEKLTRIDGPSWQWPHAGCEMCVGNALISKGFDEQYLRGLTYEQWGVLWDNVHNNPDLVKGKPRGEGYIGYEAGGSYSGRRGLLGRIFRRSRE